MAIPKDNPAELEARLVDAGNTLRQIAGALREVLGSSAIDGTVRPLLELVASSAADSAVRVFA